MFPAANPVLAPMLSPEGLEKDEAQILLISATIGPTLDEEDRGAQSPTNPKEIFSSVRQCAAMPSQFRCAMAANFSNGARASPCKEFFQWAKQRRAHPCVARRDLGLGGACGKSGCGARSRRCRRPSSPGG